MNMDKAVVVLATVPTGMSVALAFHAWQAFKQPVGMPLVRCVKPPAGCYRGRTTDAPLREQALADHWRSRAWLSKTLGAVTFQHNPAILFSA
jgi:hypothetical protein